MRIAIYHCSISIISRGKGKSAVAAAAYRAGEKIHNEYNGITSDYTNKGGIVHTEILLPDHAPAEFGERAKFWNAVEKIERNKNSQLAREITLALPVELTAAQNIFLVHEYVKQHFVDKGMCADIAVHDKEDGNPHAHIMLTMRPIEQDGTWGMKAHKIDGKKVPTIDWNEQTKAEEWRKAWADMANAELERHNHAARIDHRSYERQGVEQVPTVHLGQIATHLERRGIETERGNLNRIIAAVNAKLREIGRQISEFVQRTKTKSPKEILDKMLDTRHETQDKIRAIDGRIKTLDEHLRQADNLRKHKPIYMQYNTLPPRKQRAFRNEHWDNIEAYQKAKAYLAKHRNAEGKIPRGTWIAERERLTATKAELTKSLPSLRDTLDLAKQMSKAQPQRERSRNMDWERGR